MSTANWPPPWFEYLPDFMPKEKVLGLLEEISANAEDIRVVAEKAMSSAEKAMSAMAELIADKTTTIGSRDDEIITYVRELSQYKLVYEWRGTLDWYVRVIFQDLVWILVEGPGEQGRNPGLVRHRQRVHRCAAALCSEPPGRGRNS